MSSFDVLAILALVIACGSIALRFWEAPPELKRRMSSLELDMANHSETSTRWMKRENVRRARDDKEDAVASSDASISVLGPEQLRARKALIRARMRG